jgi:hypothetical protein
MLCWQELLFSRPRELTFTNRDRGMSLRLLKFSGGSVDDYAI